MELIRLEELEPWSIGDFRALISRLGGMQVAREINADRLIVKVNRLLAEIVLEEKPKPPVPQLIPLPANGVEFELTLDPTTQGLALVTAFGFSGNWQFTGEPVADPLTRRFKLEAVGYRPNLDAVALECETRGRVPEGSWLQAFRLAYPNNDGKGPIGVADSSWARMAASSSRCSVGAALAGARLPLGWR